MTMKPEELTSIGQELYGPKWVMSLSKKLKVNYPTVMRWRDDKTPIPGPVELALRLLLKDERRKKKTEFSFLD